MLPWDSCQPAVVVGVPSGGSGGGGAAASCTTLAFLVLLFATVAKKAPTFPLVLPLGLIFRVHCEIESCFRLLVCCSDGDKIY